MKGYLLLLLLGSLYTGISQAQSEQEAIRQWQSLHPNTQIVSEDRFNSMSQGERLLLGNDIIVYKDKITLSQLQAYDVNSEKSLESSQANKLSLEEKGVIKVWLVENSDVKIVPRSVYDSADDARKQLYSENPRCLILEGESLTVKDIERFEK